MVFNHGFNGLPPAKISSHEGRWTPSWNGTLPSLTSSLGHFESFVVPAPNGWSVSLALSVEERFSVPQSILWSVGATSHGGEWTWGGFLWVVCADSWALRSFAPWCACRLEWLGTQSPWIGSRVRCSWGSSYFNRWYNPLGQLIPSDVYKKIYRVENKYFSVWTATYVVKF